MSTKCKSKKSPIPIRCGSAERLSLFHKEWAERRAAVGEIDLMKKGLRRFLFGDAIITGSTIVGEIDLMKKGLRQHI